MLDCQSHIVRLLITISGCSLMIRKCSVDCGGLKSDGLGVSIRDLCRHITLSHCMHITVLTHRLTENRLAGLSISSQRFSLLSEC